MKTTTDFDIWFRRKCTKLHLACGQFYYFCFDKFSSKKDIKLKQEQQRLQLQSKLKTIEELGLLPEFEQYVNDMFVRIKKAMYE